MRLRVRNLFCSTLFLVGSLAVSSVAAVAQSSVTLQIGCYGGAFTDVEQRFVAEPFTARTGIKVTWINGNPSDHLAKLIASRGRPAPYDIVYLDDDIEAEAINAGVLGKSGAADAADTPGGLGTIIVKALVQQLDARMDVVSGSKGMSVSITRATIETRLPQAA